MSEVLRVLIVEDSEDDARLLVRELSRGGYEPVHERVETVGALEGALARGAGGLGEPWDLVISDYHLPSFGALEALEVVRRAGPDLPFVVVSGVVGEETAVEAMRMGAHDFVGKGNLARLGPVVDRELREARTRREAREVEKRFEALVRNSSDLVVLVDAEGTILYESPAVERLLGYKPEERVGGSALGYVHPDDRERVREGISRLVGSPGGVSSPVEYRVCDRAGRWRHFEAVGTNLLHEPGVEALVVNSRDVTERREAEEARRQGEARFRSLSEATEEGVAFHDAGRLLDSNAAFARMFGYAGPEDVIGLPVGGFIAPDPDGTGPRDLRVLERDDEGGSYELVGVRKDGTTFPVGTVDKGGTYMGRPARVSVVRDLTERRRAEEALRESEQRFRATFEQAAVGVAHVGLDGRWLRVNRRLCEIVGYEESEMLGLSFQEITHPEDLETDLGQLGRLLAGEIQTYSLEKRYLRKDRSVVWIELTVSLVRGFEGEPRYLISVVEDIGERRAAREALRESEERFRATFEQAAVGIIQVDVQGNWLRFNDRFCEIVGYEREELAEISLFHLFPPEDLERQFERGLRMVSGGLREYAEETQIVRKDGSRSWIGLNVYLVFDDSDEQRYFIGVVEDVNRRKLVEDELRLRDRAVTASTNGIIITDPSLYDDPIVYVNPAFERTTGYSAAEAMGRNCRFLQGDDCDQPALDELRAALKEGRPCTVVLRNYKKDGTPFWNELAVSPVSDGNGRLTHHVGVQNDVTERKEAEEALRDAESRFRTLVEQLPAVTYVQDPGGHKPAIYVSPQAQSMFGYAPQDDMLDTRVWEGRIHPADRERVMAEDERTDLTGEPFRVEYRTTAGDGRLLWVRDEAVLVRDDAGEPLYWLGVQFDITEQKRTEEALRRSEERFRSLIRNASDIITIMDAGGTLLYVSPSVERLTGLRPEELLGQSAFDLVHPADRVAVREAFYEALERGTEPRVEYRVLHTDGSWRYAEAVASNRIHDPAVRGVVANIRDITERREAERASRESEERLRAVVAGAPVILFAIDREGVFTMSDGKGLELLGLGPGDLEGKNAFEVYADHPKVAANMRRALAGETFSDVLEIGDVLFETWYSPLRGARNEGVEGVIGVATDVTERERATAELKESEERFRATFEQAAVGVSIVAPDGRVLRVNDKLCEILGYSKDEVVGQNVRRVSFREDLEEDQRRLARALAGETGIYPVEKRYIRKDGSAVWVNLSSSVVRDARGEPAYLVGVTEDITERKQTEEALAQSEERYRTVVEQAADCIFLVDAADGAILETNAAFERLLGYGEEEATNLTVFDISAHSRESVERNIRRALREGSLSIGERGYVCKDGRTMDVEVGISAMRQAGLEVLCVVAHDITERKETEKSLRRTLSVLLALREAGQLLSSTLESEEIVTRLLNVMRGVSELSAAVISVPEGGEEEERRFRVWRSSGLGSLWEKARYAPEAEEARRSVLASGRRCFFRLHGQNGGGNLPSLYLPLKSRDRTVGILECYGTAYLEGEDAAGLLESLASQAASALENARLYGELAERERRLQDLVGKILVAQEEERRRVAYEVHDGLAQAAAAAHQRLQSFAYRHPPATEAGERDLQRALGLVQRTVRDARKVIANLRPTVLDDFGLAAAVRHEVDELREEGWQMEYEERLGEERLPVVVETSLFRVAQEALTNARKHSGTNRARLELVRAGETVRLQVEDYGEGFEPESATFSTSGGGGPGERVGLSGMRERVNMLGGELELRSSPGKGTVVEAWVPIPENAEPRGSGLPTPGGGG